MSGAVEVAVVLVVFEGEAFAGPHGFAEGIRGGVAEFFEQRRGGVEQQAPAGFAAARFEPLIGLGGFGFGLGAFSGHPQFEGEGFEFGVFGGQLVGVFEGGGRVGQEVVEFGVVAVAFALQAGVVFGKPVVEVFHAA